MQPRWKQQKLLSRHLRLSSWSSLPKLSVEAYRARTAITRIVPREDAEPWLCTIHKPLVPCSAAHGISQDPGAHSPQGPSVILCSTATINSLSLGKRLLTNTLSWLFFLQKESCSINIRIYFQISAFNTCFPAFSRFFIFKISSCDKDF